MFLFFSYFLSLEEDFVRWREAFWPAVLSKYNIDVREIKRYISTSTKFVCYVCNIILFFVFWVFFFPANAFQCEGYKMCSPVAVAPHCPKWLMTLGVTFWCFKKLKNCQICLRYQVPQNCQTPDIFNWEMFDSAETALTPNPLLKMGKRYTLSDITYVYNFSGDYLLALIDNSDLKFLRIFQRTKFILEKWINWSRTSLKDRKCRQEIGHIFVSVCS